MAVLWEYSVGLSIFPFLANLFPALPLVVTQINSHRLPFFTNLSVSFFVWMADYCSKHSFSAISGGTFGWVFCWLKETAHLLLFPCRKGDLGLFLWLISGPICLFSRQIEGSVLLLFLNRSCYPLWMTAAQLARTIFTAQHTRNFLSQAQQHFYLFFINKQV